MVEAPEHEVPRRAVPQAAQQHRDHQIAAGHPARAAVAAQRLVQVVGQPARQADVPAPPEVRRVGREVRQAEVQRELEAHQPRHAARDVGVAREIAVDLEGEGQHAGHHRRGVGRGAAAEGRIHPGRQVVGDVDLLEVAPQHQVQALDHHVALHRARADHLRQQRRGALDRAGHQMREIQHRQEEVPERVAGMQLAAVDVDGVGHRLEGVERDRHRQHDLHHLQRPVQPEQPTGIHRRLGEEVGVLEEAQQTQVQRDAQLHPALAHLLGLAPAHRLGQLQRDVIVDRRGEQQRQQKAPVPAGVEHAAGDDQEDVLSAVRKQVVDHQHQRQEQQDEFRRIEKHDPPLDRN